MKALLSLKSAICQSSNIGIIALALLVPVIFPEIALAAELQTLGQQAQIFEIKITDSGILDQSQKPKEQTLTIKELEDSDPLVSGLKQYLEKHRSPLAVYSAQIVKQPQWARALAISHVESNMGIHCFDNNCSGIGVKPGHPSWRKYKTKLDWFIDLNNLLEKPIYKEKYTTFKKMRGVYVQPGSDNWVNGAQKKYDDFMAITAQAELDRQALAQSHVDTITALITFPENIN